MAVIQCSECERKIKVPDESAGRKVRCPHCKAVIAVPAPEENVRPAPKSPKPVEPEIVEETEVETPRRKRPRRDDDDDNYDDRRSRRRGNDDDDLDEDQPKSRRRRDERQTAKSGKGLLIGLCIGIGVLVLGGGAVAFFLMRGRGPAVDIRTLNDMKMIGLAYHSHLGAFRKPPARAEDLRAFLAESPTAFQRLTDGQVVFFWNVGMEQMTAGSSNTILAHERDAPAKGGLVLFGDGSARAISLDEFQKTAKAQAGGKSNPNPTNPPVVAGEWKEYASKSGEYTILLPATGMQPTEDALTVKETLQPVFSLRLTLPDKTLYQLVLTQFPAKFIADNPRAGLLKRFLDAAIDLVRGQIIEESKSMVANEPAVNATLKIPGPGRGYVRVFIANNSSYQLLVLGPENSPYVKEASKFFDSVKIRPKTAVTPSNPTSPKIETKIPEPTNARVGAKLAEQYANAKQFREAAIMFEKTAPLDPKLKAWHLKEAAVNWLKAQNKEKALAAAKSAIAGDPEKRNPLIAHFWHRGLGEVFLETGQYPLAIEHLEKAIQNTDIEGYIKDCRKLLDEARKKGGN